MVLLFYYIGSSNKIIYQVELSTPWDLSTAGIESSSNALVNGTYQSLVISSDGLKAYILNSTTDMVQVYSFGNCLDSYKFKY